MEFANLINNGFIHLEISLNLCFECKEKTSSSYIEEYRYIVYYDQFDSIDEERIKVGEGSFKIFNAALAKKNKEYASEIFDGSSFEDTVIYTTFYVYDTYRFDKNLFKLNNINNVVGSNLGYLERLELHYEYRNKGVGAYVLNQICNWLSTRVNFIAFKSFPLQFESGSQKDIIIDSENQNLESAKNKLDNYYNSIGFKKLILTDDHTNKEESFFYWNPKDQIIIGKYKFI